MSINVSPQRFVSYLRVSTKTQGTSGLGIDGQRTDVQRYVEANAGQVLREFVEIESGKKADRPQLSAAITYARRAKAVLVVAKLDRLSRNVAFLAALMESGIDFVAVDNPHATRFTIHILAAVAELEREMIVKRTKAALVQAKERGVALGSRRPDHWAGREDRRRAGSKLGSQRAAVSHRQAADASYADVAPVIAALSADGVSLRRIAARLNEEGTLTRRGCHWTAHAVRMVLLRSSGNTVAASPA